MVNGDGLVVKCQEYAQGSLSGSNNTPVAQHRGQLGTREELETLTGLNVDATSMQKKGMGMREKVSELEVALEKAQDGKGENVPAALEIQVKNMKLGLLGANNKQVVVENQFSQWEEVDKSGRGFKRNKSSSLSPPKERKKVRSLLGQGMEEMIQ